MECEKIKRQLETSLFERLLLSHKKKNEEVALALYHYLLEHHIHTIIDEWKNLSIGNRIKDVYVLETPKFIVLGNYFDGVHYELEDTRTNQKLIVAKEEIIYKLRNNEGLS